MVINHIPESMKKSGSNTKQKVMRIFESKIKNSKSRIDKTRKTRETFGGKYVEYKSEKDKKSSLRKYLEKIGLHLRDMIDELKIFGE